MAEDKTKKPRKPKAKKLEVVESPVAEITADIFTEVTNTTKEIVADVNKKEALIEKLKHEVLTIEFTKVDGSVRVMNATLNNQIVPARQIDNDSIKLVASNPDLICVWDIDASGWRSFKVSSLKKINNKLV